MGTDRTAKIINEMERTTFVQSFGGIFENSPWVAERAWSARPFNSVDDLHQAMVDVVDNASHAEQLNLLCAHPDLAGTEARAGSMTNSSTAEQTSAGLDALSKDELARIARFNAQYREKFTFPFIIAVRNHTKQSIFAEFERRLTNDADTELRNAIGQIFLITRLRLDKFSAVTDHHPHTGTATKST